LLSWLPEDLSALRLLDAGCGTGALSLEAAGRGADVVAIDLSPTLVNLARERACAQPAARRIDFRAGDMLDGQLGDFDVVVGMDSLIHYQPSDVVRVLSSLAARTRQTILFTFPPRNLALAAMMSIGKLFPRGDRAPFIEPVAYERLCRLIQCEPGLSAFRIGRTQKISSGFYTSQALELVRTA
jgi:magnesium-protoporphyrin O-methyltransferase